MNAIGFEILQAQVEAMKTTHSIGRVAEIGGGAILVSGLSKVAALGDLVKFETATGITCGGEILRLADDTVSILADAPTEGLQIGDRAVLLGNSPLSPHESWLGRVIDPFGQALDGKPIVPGSQSMPIRGQAIPATQRRGLGQRMETGMAVFNTLLPIVRGQRIGLFAGSGVGKSTLLARLALGLQADVVVIAMIGERGREVREFVERVLGPVGMQRAVIVAATSDQSPLTRRRCAMAAMTVAEYFRDTGRQVLFVADSVTRFAEAHREVAVVGGEASTLRGFPPSTAHQITSLCERAGPGTSHSGDITAVFSVLVAGSDMEEPIADILRGVLDGHVVLDRQIAERGRFPAIDLLRSVSRSLPDAASAEENEVIFRARASMGLFERNEMMVRAGLYTKGTDPQLDLAIEYWPKLDSFLAAKEVDGISASFDKLQACMDASKENSTSDGEL